MRVAIIGGVRTPFVKAQTEFRSRTALELAVHAVNGLLSRHYADPAVIQELAYGNVVLDPRIPHLAREIVFESNLPTSVNALTLSNNCITGCSALATIANSINAERIEVGIAGGVESMSNPALLFNPRASRLFLEMAATRALGVKISNLIRLRPRDLLPATPEITEPSTGLSMGQHCELMAKQWNISRSEQDAIAYQSHKRAHAATEDGRLTEEITPLEGLDRDPLIRPDTNLMKLAGLRTVFDKSRNGSITAGNSSPLTDGAAAILLMSNKRAEQDGQEVLAFITDIEFAAIDPRDGLLMAPALAVPRLLARAGLTLSEIDIVEIHEAFGAQVTCNLKAWADGWKEQAIGKVDPEQLNPLGSSIAVGHPFAATGIRIATTLAYEMKRRGARRGLISICGAGATAAAVLLER